MTILADVTFGQVLLTVVEVFLFIAWFWILISVLGDLFRDHDSVGVGEGRLDCVLLFLPFLGRIRLPDRARRRDARTRRQGTGRRAEAVR